MATITLGGNEIHTTGELPAVGDSAPAFSLVGRDWSAVDSESLSGQRVVLNIFPSIDTPTCAASVRHFNESAAALDNTTIVNVSADLPPAIARFCGAEGIENATSGSTFRSSFGQDFGVVMADGKLEGLLARAVVVVDEGGTVIHSQLVPEIASEPDYDSALSSLA